MNNQANITTTISSANQPAVYYRLIAIWVLCEAMLGGIIHGFKIPVSGLVVGSCAIVCICMIGWYAPARGAILKATIIVAIFKMMLSPQAPPPAYIAVFFQGLLGELLFRNRKMFPVSCIVLAVLGLLESGLQRILVLTIVYGNDFWRVVNNFFNGLIKQKGNTNYSFWIGSVYVLLHLVTGFIVGWWASRLPGRIEKWSGDSSTALLISSTGQTLPSKAGKKRKFRIGMLIIWLLLVGLYVQSYFKIGTPLLSAHISMKILLRSLIIVFGWMFIVGPLLKQLLHGWLKKKQTQSRQEVQEVLQLLPVMQDLVVEAWRRSGSRKGLKRIQTFSKLVLVNALGTQAATGTGSELFILTAPIQSGKTTSLIKWSENRSDIFGILTPVVDGKRVFMNAQNRQLFLMEARDGEQEILQVGRFTFSKTNFDRATKIIRDNMHQPGWLVIDEIGPMEIRGEGFHDLLQEVIAERKGKILLVVREKENMLQQVREKFGLHQAQIVRSPPRL